MTFTVRIQNDFAQLIEQSGIGRARIHQMKALEAAGIKYVLDGDDYDILHINTVFPQSLYHVLKAKYQGKAIIYHAHSTEEDFRDSFILSNQLSKYFKKWLVTCYQQADLILTPTEYSKNLLENYHLKPPIEVISNGIDMSYWQANRVEVDAFRQDYQLEPGHPLIIGVGMLIKRKGILDFIDLARRMPECQFIWFGHTNSNIQTSEVKRAIHSKPDNLLFAGYVDRDVLRVAYQVADIFLFLTYEETEGIVLLEALASGTQTIIRDIPIFDVYQDQHITYKARDNDGFQKLIQMYLDGDLAYTGACGRVEAQARSIEGVGMKYRKYYQEALDLAAQKKKKT
ncbi:glycosyltransferase family 4 protein [Hutsoniella sourekii]